MHYKMNRETKQRAWHPERKKMIYSDETQGDTIAHRMYLFWMGMNIGEEIAKVNCEFMQGTGLKDKNGKDIYEGDIIQHNDKNFVCNWSKIFGHCFVELNKNLGTFHWDGIVMTNHNRRKQSEIINYIKYVEVIGNIYQNPELIIS